MNGRLTVELELEIRNNLEHIKDKLYHNVSHYEDSVWMANIISKLLLEIYFLKDELNCKGDD